MTTTGGKGGRGREYSRNIQGKRQRLRRCGTRSGNSILSAARCRAYGKVKGKDAVTTMGVKRIEDATTTGGKGDRGREYSRLMRGKKQRIRRDGTRRGHATLSAARCRDYGKGEGEEDVTTMGVKGNEDATTVRVKGKDTVTTMEV